MSGERRKRTPNRELLRHLKTVLAAESWIEQGTVFPTNRPESLVLTLIPDYYPREHVAEAYLEVQSYINGDFHITYVEDWNGETVMCRWDRHDSDDYSRDHFHTLPDARHEDGVNRDYPKSLSAVIAEVIAPWVYTRMGDIWDETDSM